MVLDITFPSSEKWRGKKLLKRIWVHSVQEMQPSDKLITIIWHCFIIIDLEKSQGSPLTTHLIHYSFNSNFRLSNDKKGPFPVTSLLQSMKPWVLESTSVNFTFG